MNRLIPSMTINKVHRRHLSGILAMLLLSACQNLDHMVQITPKTIPRALSPQDEKASHQIELFFDGTSNDWQARTNVRRRFEMVAWQEDPAFPCCYIEGVGEGNSLGSLSGKVFGFGMKSRVLQGYNFLARNWRKGDTVFIFGFSRGAFEARMLAGLLAHCGLPSALKEPYPSRRLDRTLDQIYDYCAASLKDPEGAPTAKDWDTALSNNRRQTQRTFASSGFAFNDGNQVKIEFLGLWDTVPGLPFIKSLTEMATPQPGRPQEYKVRPYPNIKV
ncbi:MAG: hypothetical protein JWO94_721, partial [Verrucomicrobiaceae bacterium]|nr:hypothetical protein [Verrucomicrobiaceae bacterium]